MNEIIPNYEEDLKELQRKAWKKPSTIFLILALIFCIFMLIRGLINSL